MTTIGGSGSEEFMVDAATGAAESGAAPHPVVRVIHGNTDRYLVRGGRTHALAADAAALAALPGKLRDWTANWLWGLERLSYADYEFLAKLPGECDLSVPGFGPVIGYHGTPGDDEGHLLADTPDEAAADALLEREGRLGIGGHIHRQFDRTLSTGWRVVNVGSVGMAFDRPGFAQWGWFTFAGDQVTVDLRAVPYDVDAAIADLRAVGYPSVDAVAHRLRNGEPA